MLTINELATLYALKERTELEKRLDKLDHQIQELNDWFDTYTKTFTNSVWTNAAYDSAIRKPYNEMFDFYEKVLELYRVTKYYLEKL